MLCTLLFFFKIFHLILFQHKNSFYFFISHFYKKFSQWIFVSLYSISKNKSALFFTIHLFLAKNVWLKYLYPSILYHKMFFFLLSCSNESFLNENEFNQAEINKFNSITQQQSESTQTNNPTINLLNDFLNLKKRSKLNLSLPNIKLSSSFSGW